MNSFLILIIQIGIIIVTSRIVGYLFRKIGQPQVIGEMTAGILLGPSLLGWLAPDAFEFVFPSESLINLEILSYIGLLLFMFIVGLELDPSLLKGRRKASALISNFSIIMPFILGIILALYIYPDLAGESVDFLSFSLFLSASLSVTAFPVLARILIEQNLLKTKLGAVSVVSAAINDITAWTILSIVVTIVRSGSTHVPLWFTISGSFSFILIMLFIVRPILTKLETFYKYKGNRVSHDILAIILLLMLSSAWVTEWLGIHALFGAFFMGAIIPRNKNFLQDILRKIDDVTLILLLPIFFTLTGIRTSITLLDDPQMWFYFFLILLVAVTGKTGGSFLAARISSLNWRESLGIGFLMNTRGLMELIIITIGLELGVISPSLFAMLVLMALVTTFMTTPLLEWVYPKERLRKEMLDAKKEIEKKRILIPVSLPSSGPGLLNIASAMMPKNEFEVYALHLSKPLSNLFSPPEESGIQSHTTEAFIPLLKEAEELKVNVHPISFTTQNAAEDIINISHLKNINAVLMGWHKPVMSESILSGTVNEVMKNVKADVYVYLQRVFTPYKNILVPFTEGVHDRGALETASRVALNLKAKLTILHIVQPGGVKKEILDKNIFNEGNIELLFLESDSPLDTTLKVSQKGYDLIVIGLAEKWGIGVSLFSKKHEMLAHKCPASLLIQRKYVH